MPQPPLPPGLGPADAEVLTVGAFFDQWDQLTGQR
jgi:hypothetical protein